jgi:hypothetical protein
MAPFLLLRQTTVGGGDLGEYLGGDFWLIGARFQFSLPYKN